MNRVAVLVDTMHADLPQDAGVTYVSCEEPYEALIVSAGHTVPQIVPKQLRVIVCIGDVQLPRPLEVYAAQGIVVLHVLSAQANAVKELMLASLLAAARPIAANSRWVKETQGQQRETAPPCFVGSELAGKTLGVIGLTETGALIANDAHRLGMRVVAYDPHVSVDAVWRLSRHVQRAFQLSELLQAADYICVQEMDAVYPEVILDEEAIAQLKPHAVVVNFAHPQAVAVSAVRHALLEGRLKHYVSDFIQPELCDVPQVTCYSGIKSATQEAYERSLTLAVQRVVAFFETGNIEESRNFATVSLPFYGSCRLAVINRNVVNMVGQMSTGLAHYGINIEHIVNRSKGAYAYTLIDIAEVTPEVEATLLAQIEKVEGVISVRFLRRHKKGE